MRSAGSLGTKEAGARPRDVRGRLKKERGDRKKGDRAGRQGERTRIQLRKREFQRVRVEEGIRSRESKRSKDVSRSPPL